MQNDEFLESSFIIQNSSLFILSMQPMTAAAAAELVELEPSGRVLLVLRRYIVPLFALGALQNDIISRAFSHFFPQ